MTLALTENRVHEELTKKLIEGKRTNLCPFCGKRQSTDMGHHVNCWNQASREDRMEVNRIEQSVIGRI